MFDEIVKGKNNNKLTQYIIDKMLSTSESLEDIDVKTLWQWLKMNDLINEYNQFKIIGAYRDKEFEKFLAEDFILLGYTTRIILLAHNFSNILMKNRKTSITTWNDLWTEINCSKRQTQQKIKKFIIKHDIIREMVVFDAKKEIKVKKFILNPFVFRSSAYTSQLAIATFKDKIEEGRNMNTYLVRFLKAIGVI